MTLFSRELTFCFQTHIIKLRTTGLLLQSQDMQTLHRMRILKFGKGTLLRALSCAYPLCPPCTYLLDSPSVSSRGLYQLFLNKSLLCSACLTSQGFLHVDFHFGNDAGILCHSGQFCIFIASCFVVSLAM